MAQGLSSQDEEDEEELESFELLDEEELESFELLDEEELESFELLDEDISPPHTSTEIVPTDPPALAVYIPTGVTPEAFLKLGPPWGS